MVSLQSQSQDSPLAVLGWVARARAFSSFKGLGTADKFLLDRGAPEHAQRIIKHGVYIKAAVGAGSTANNILGDYAIAIGPFSQTMSTASVFFRLLSDSVLVRLPLRTRVGVAAGAASAAVTAEGQAVPVCRVTIDNVTLDTVRAAGLLVVTKELVLDTGPAGQQLFNRSLRNALAEIVDHRFLEIVLGDDTAAQAFASSGPEPEDALRDLRRALLSVNSVGDAKLYWVVAPDVAKKASTLGGNGTNTFPAMSATGGEMANLPALVSSGVPAGMIYLLDASGIAADADEVDVRVSNQADVLMDTAPSMNSATPTAAQMVSMFQTNSVALLATAMFGAQRLRDDAIALIEGVDWGNF